MQFCPLKSELIEFSHQNLSNFAGWKCLGKCCWYSKSRNGNQPTGNRWARCLPSQTIGRWEYQILNIHQDFKQMYGVWLKPISVDEKAPYIADTWYLITREQLANLALAWGHHQFPLTWSSWRSWESESGKNKMTSMQNIKTTFCSSLTTSTSTMSGKGKKVSNLSDCPHPEEVTPWNTGPSKLNWQKVCHIIMSRSMVIQSNKL